MWVLTADARDDLDRISLWGLERFGLNQAEKYDLRLADTFDALAANPRMAPERLNFGRSVRLMTCEANHILYVIDGDDIIILRVLHHLQDWFDLL
ncbi:type II toxin-antitoxin system RelE/ParE family toxin [Devosia sediminis]|uniref:Type II toxin-antitoxin system RelE/ParE family toxin n=1 Tax=Devosia sediminis TaxID=2798801 RepID=A0A934IUB0_9HYPH|nr:type II toxin-antitoxin system RelE/ParE family toxin [Devosia sediminis]MBJ3786878.1 type II toxin-antitoxin system RelE/ParE family toxin [Devosia sediminis]